MRQGVIELLLKGEHRIAGKASGFTLLELLISVAVLGIMMVGFHQAITSALSAHEQATDSHELLSEARFALERMNSFVRETDCISSPDDVDQEILRVSDRVLDTYDNTSRAYDVDGDGRPDADNDSDGLINEDGLNTEAADPFDYVTFDLDKTDPGNWKLREELPDYGTAKVGDYKAHRVLCEHVAAFRCSRLSMGGALVEIRLTLENGGNDVSLSTRARARLLE